MARAAIARKDVFASRCVQCPSRSNAKASDAIACSSEAATEYLKSKPYFQGESPLA
jgi:hypothetical protein